MNAGYYRLWHRLIRAPVLNSFHKEVRVPVVSRTMAVAQNDIDEELRNNPYYEKYKSKINELQKSSPEDFKFRVEETTKRKTKPTLGSADDRAYSSVSQPKENLADGQKVHHKRKALDDVMKMELIKDLPAEEIAKLWETHFKSKDAISATIPCDLYKMMSEKGKKYPVFVLPLPRDQGYEFFMCQIDGECVHFTSLINYQAHKENAPECLSIVHYTELEDKNIVLMHGEFDKNVVDAKEAQCLANQFQLYYGQDNEKRINLLERLNYNPSEFKHMDLVAELESLSL